MGNVFFDQPVKNSKTTYENIRKIATGQRDDYTTGYLQIMTTLDIIKRLQQI